MKNKALTGIMFIFSCFVAMFVLVEFHSNYVLVGIAALLLLISSFCFLNAVFAKKSKEWSALEEEENKKEYSGSNDAEFKRKVVNYMDTINKNQAQLLQELKGLEEEISSLSEKQTFQTKMVVKYNKENAKQVALNERKVVGQAVSELKEVIKGGMVIASSGVVTDKVKTPVMEEMILAEEPVELPKMEEMVLPEESIELPKMEEMILPEEPIELPVMEEMVLPEEPMELSKMEEMILPEEPMELPVMEEMVLPEESIELPKMEEMILPEESIELPKMEEMILSEEPMELPKMEDLDLPILDDIVIPEEKPVDSSPVVDSDPNKMMTPDDIAKLLASMGM